MNWVGWVGSLCLGLCGLPQAIKCYQTKSAKDISAMFLLLWLTGEICTLIYVIPKWDWPLIINYLFNIILIGVIANYKVKK